MLLRSWSFLLPLCCASATLLGARAAGAQTPLPEAEGAPPPAPSSPFTLGGLVEAYYQWNFGEPSNGLTHFRGFDSRHDTFTLSSASLDALWDDGELVGRATLQFGAASATSYAAEPSLPGAPGASGSSAEVWRYLQQAYAGYRVPVGEGLTLTAGLFLSPVGPEAMAVRDNWNWSRSNLFFGLPFYHTGLRASYPLSERWDATLAVYNGWNSVVDNNDGKTLSAQLNYHRPEVAAAFVYLGGPERAAGATEGRGWRHLFDAHATWHAAPWLSLAAYGDGGWEQTRFGTSRWGAGALYARVRLAPPLYLAVRSDAFWESTASGDAGEASPIFWPAPWVSSGTATLDYRAHERATLRLEYRHDRAGADLYFGGDVVGDGEAVPFVMNRRAQDTVTLGVSTWF